MRFPPPFPLSSEAIALTWFAPNSPPPPTHFNSLHAGAWLARILACAGATSISDPDSALSALEANLSAPIGPKTKRWIGALLERESFQQVYGEGLH